MMTFLPFLVVSAMLLVPSGQQPPNPWKEKVPQAVEKVEAAPSVSTYRQALDVAWRADDWRAGLKLAREALDKYPDEAALRGIAARAFWRAGRLKEAEALADQIGEDTQDPVALTTLIEVRLARGELERAGDAATRLEKLGPKSATELYYLAAARFAQDRLAGLASLLRQATRRVDPAHGYPEIYLGEALEGLPQFFAAVGTEPLSQITGHGAADMPQLLPGGLPHCLATINGAGPFRLILDTGGSIALSLDSDAARDLQLKSLGTASIRGVSGKQDSEQALVDELQIGEIVCRRVMTRVFDLPAVVKPMADGILGTGVFTRGRATLDFQHARLIVAPTSDAAAPGSPADLRIVADAKLIAAIKLQDEPALALLDSGASVAAISASRLRALFPDRELSVLPAQGMGVGQGGQAGIVVGPGVKLELWGRTYENYSGIALDVIDTLLAPIVGVQTDVLVGMPVFRDMKSFTVDFPERRMWVEWLAEPRAEHE
jgi:tetratricopeptide (TPR) repeat protein